MEEQWEILTKIAGKEAKVLKKIFLCSDVPLRDHKKHRSKLLHHAPEQEKIAL